jgi:membrane protease subunit HflK
VGRDNVIKATGLRESAMLTQDENIVEIKFAVQYRLNDARAYLFESKSPDDAVVQAAETAVREVVGKSMDSVLADERDQIAPRVRKPDADHPRPLQVGIEVVTVNLQQGGVRPPEQVQAAFDDVLKAGQERERVKNEARPTPTTWCPRASVPLPGSRKRPRLQGAHRGAGQGDAQRFRRCWPNTRRRRRSRATACTWTPCSKSTAT